MQAAFILKKDFDNKSTYILTYRDLEINKIQANLRDAVQYSKKIAKKYARNLVLCNTAISEYYVRGSLSLNECIIFKDEDFVLSSVDSSKYWVEGPFPTEEAAREFCLNAFGAGSDVQE